MVIKKQGDRDEGDNVAREIWEDLGKIQGRSREEGGNVLGEIWENPGKIQGSMHQGKRNEVEKRKM